MNEPKVRCYDEQLNKLFYYPEFAGLDEGQICHDKNGYFGIPFKCNSIGCDECLRNSDNKDVLQRNLDKLL